MATFSQTSGGPSAQPNTPTKQYFQAGQRAQQTDTGNVRRPISGTGTPSRGTIINNPEVDACAVDAVRISYVTITKISLGGAKPDVPCVFDFPVTKVWVASKDSGHLSDSLYLHLSPLRKTYPGGNAIAPDGTEGWFDMTLYGVSGQTFLGKIVEFAKPISRCFFDIGQEAGGTNYFITIAGSNDVADISANQIGVTAS